MNYNIRPLQQSDYALIKEWWSSYKEICPSFGLIPKNTTFIIEVNNKPVMSMGLYLTNSELAYVENYISDPNFNDNLRDSAAKRLAQYIISFAKQLGYKRLYCSTKHEKLANRYKDLGMTYLTTGIYALSMEI